MGNILVASNDGGQTSLYEDEKLFVDISNPPS